MKNQTQALLIMFLVNLSSSSLVGQETVAQPPPAVPVRPPTSSPLRPPSLSPPKAPTQVEGIDFPVCTKGRVETGHIIGSGFDATVYEYCLASNCGYVAKKYNSNQSRKGMYLNELRILSRLKGSHLTPEVVCVIPDQLAFVMEKWEGSVKDYLRTHKVKMDDELVAKLLNKAREISYRLAFDYSIVHNDFHLANLVFRKRGELEIAAIDFSRSVDFSKRDCEKSADANLKNNCMLSKTLPREARENVDPAVFEKYLFAPENRSYNEKYIPDIFLPFYDVAYFIDSLFKFYSSARKTIEIKVESKNEAKNIIRMWTNGFFMGNLDVGRDMPMGKPMTKSDELKSEDGRSYRYDEENRVIEFYNQSVPTIFY